MARHVSTAPLTAEPAAHLSWPWLIAALIAFVANLALHLPLTDVADGLAARLGFLVYDRLMTVAFLLLAAAALLAALVRRTPSGPVAWTTAMALVACAVLAHQLLLVASIENIHYPQYALVAFLLGRSGMPTEASWVGATLLGMVDEWYQYVFLPRGRPNYLDWNDILLNALGAAFGVVILLLYRRARLEHPLCSTPVVAAAVGLALAVALWTSPPALAPFFQATPIGRRYHILSAAEGVGLIGLLWLGVHYVLTWHAQRATVP